MRFIFSLLLVSLLCVSCDRSLHKTDGVSLVKIGNSVLTREEVDKNLYQELSPEDSIIAAEHVIRSWINDQLMFDVASKNISDEEEINKLVENYRRSLIIYQYQEQLINEKLNEELNDDLLLHFYEENKNGFILDRPLIKGVVLMIPNGAPQIDNVKTWYKSMKPDDLEKIERYSIQNSASYDYSVDQWIDFNQLIENWPENYRDRDNIIKYNKYIEQQDSSFYYFLNITDFLLPGENTPFEYTKPILREMLLNRKKLEFLKKTEEELYQRALSRGQITFYDE